MSTTKTSAQVPKLRFPGFEGVWNSTIFEKELIESKLGGDYANSEAPTPYPLIKMGNLGRGSMNLDKLEYIQDTEVVDPDDEMKPGDLFFNTRNTLDLVGKVAIWRSELPRAYYNSNILRITFACNSFMNYRLNSWAGIKSLRRLATGTTSVAAIYNRDLFKMRMTVPTVPEQQKIAAFLTVVDGRIEQLSRKKALLEEYKKGVMQQIFTKTLRFQDDHGHDFPDWEEKTLGEILTIGSGRDYKHLSRGNVPVYGSGGVMTYVDKALYEGESVCIGRKGTIDKPRFVEGAFWTVDTLFYTHSFNGVSPRFVYVLFQRINWQTYNEASGVPSLSKSTIENIPITIPHPDEQTKIAALLSALDGKIAAVGQQMRQTQAWKKGLLQQMFV